MVKNYQPKCKAFVYSNYPKTEVFIGSISDTCAL